MSNPRKEVIGKHRDGAICYHADICHLAEQVPGVLAAIAEIEKRNGVVQSRGNPEGPTLHGKEIEPVHYRMPAYSDGTREGYPACLNGAFNIRWTKKWTLVTCPECLAPKTMGDVIANVSRRFEKAGGQS